MKSIFTPSIIAVALFASAGHSVAADFDAEQAIQGLVVSGVVESWNGYTFASIDNSDPGDPEELDKDDYFSSGLAGRLSLPLGDRLSLQMDGSLEYTEGAFDDADNTNVFEYASQFGVHLTYRDPSSFAFGAFGAFGGGSTEDEPYDGYIVGGEAQLYLGEFTLYGQGGYLDSIDRSGEPGNALNDAFFVRGVGRWYLMPDSRLQAEVAYASGQQDDDNDDMHVLAWGARYDTILAGLPILGDTHVFVGYRGNWGEVDDPDDATDRNEYIDHTIMIGTQMSFGGSSMQETERFGAGLDLPDFNRWIGLGPIVD